METEPSVFQKLIAGETLIQKVFRKEILPILADLRLAILLLLIIAVFSISGTLLEQGQSLEYYQSNYPEHPALFGFLTWKIIIFIGLDHVYRTWWFLSLLVLFGSSLTACTFTRQLPTLKSARRWTYYDKPQQFQSIALSAELTTGSLTALEPLLKKRHYLVFQDGNKLYARRGIIGRIGPIVVHGSMLIILAGSIIGSITGFTAQEMVPGGNVFQVKNILDAGQFSQAQIPKDWAVKVNRFWIDYDPDGRIDQFYSDLSVINKQGEEVERKTIHVNEPFRYQGVTFYQADWGIGALRVRVNKSPVFRLPMAPLDTGGQGRIWGTWIPIKPDFSAGVSVLAKDLKGTVLVYNGKGELVSTVREGMSTEVDGVTLFIDEVVGSTGLQIKADPGIPIVYLGFGLLMISVMMSYVSHSQIWALKEGERLYIAGKTNRAKVTFEREIVAILDDLNDLDQNNLLSVGNLSENLQN
ncbi:cytochrome c biogenesis protein [Planktothrix pseudagardhii]|uniref:Cytochrome c biogenesis protein CcsB n=1 Tax=Planktothrix pseudagardhii TaxID=132604 RepID=A0A9W4D955_9CYAN|nr:cytochrome c biogenesis protein [Planktothrix pseudagardhii]CAD5982325.1 Cytochrome c biogenesis protein CcsB [Planktothrix pseudagardhii]